MTATARPSVLVFAGLDPSGGAGIAADIEAIAAQGAHALPVVTALTVQDNNRVHGVEPIDPALLLRQAQALAQAVQIRAVKLGIPGSGANAAAIAQVITRLRAADPLLPVVLDPVLASGHGDALARGDAVAALRPLLALATLVVPNLPEAQALGPVAWPRRLVTGGHADGARVVNRWHGPHGTREWSWPRLPGQFHGSGCTLAAAIAGQLALGRPMEMALDLAQRYCHRALEQAYAIAPGQLIPNRHPWTERTA
ncbi:bifunctional hydroxymethylpyrimidine kinase/phosphomethylpyrimidine kinase [Massilia solisilvae]|uniref:Bifunctional hydroxymethylpyrimidine kinase/phosphomethylpyrimidine kinase n=1 Tax=Massilia solisilvae TaxID=1811225 RepID=A0ABT2BQ97_9BURK|nr:bifunctional hydroxymethylpyrimidine kinase/phosphomethylpyrimidine kinase [Massilia solisilvae]MCS0610686.1 bifunctional hydroxymethylpyrimidine kinase/phosphomethylpyrimidine kinase [Massilia solisilvae]